MPTQVNKNFSLLSSMIDESFDASRVSEYGLILQVSPDGTLAAVKEKQKNRFIAFENYSFRNNFDLSSASGFLEEIAVGSQLFASGYDSVRCVITNNLSTIVPDALYEADRKKLYLKFNLLLEGDELIVADDIPSLDAKNVYALPLNLKIKTDTLFKNIRYQHYSTLLLESLLAQNKNSASKKIFAHVHSSRFEVIVTEGKKLLFYNTFNHHSAEDFIYYLLFVCEQLHLNPEQAEVTLLGEIEKNSAIYLLMQKYIRNIVFGSRPDNADFSYQLQAIPKHYYYTLFNGSSL